MPWNGSGTFNRDYSWAADAAASIRIRADRMDGEFNNYKGGLENCLTRTGETTPLANTSWNNFKITNLADATNAKDAANVKVVQNGGFLWGGTSTGAANTYAVTLIPAITAYTTGLVVRFLAHQANTGAATLNVNSVGAATIVRASGVTLASGDIPNGALVHVVYDGTNFRLVGTYSAATIADSQKSDYLWGGTSTGAANVYAISLTPALTAYNTGLIVHFLTHQANTGAATLNINSVGAVSILGTSGSALIVGEIANGAITSVIYDGTNFRLLAPAIDWDTKVRSETQGDIPYFGTSGAPSRLAAGSNGQVLITQGAGANPTYRDLNNLTVFTSSGTWTVPANVTRAEVTVVGGGGAGTTTAPATGAGGGGGGGTAIKLVTGLTPGAGVTITVGSAGGTSSFGGSCSATGGAAGSGTTGGAGGSGSGGDINITGSSGENGHSSSGGTGGDSFIGSGGRGAVSAGAGNIGGSYGAGGGGGFNTGAGGAGVQGIVIIRY